jgi:hypothetical protein
MAHRPLRSSTTGAILMRHNLVPRIIRPSIRRCLACTAISVAACIGMLGALWISVFWHALPSMLREASALSLQFKTSTLSIVGFGGFLISLWIKWHREGASAMKKHLAKHLLESLIPAALALGIVFLYHLTYVIPERMALDQKRLLLTLAPVLNPKKPDGWDKQSKQPSRRKAGGITTVATDYGNLKERGQTLINDIRAFIDFRKDMRQRDLSKDVNGQTSNAETLRILNMWYASTSMLFINTCQPRCHGKLRARLLEMKEELKTKHELSDPALDEVVESQERGVESQKSLSHPSLNSVQGFQQPYSNLVYSSTIGTRLAILINKIPDHK